MKLHSIGRCCHCRVQLEQEKTKCWNRRKCYRTACWILVVQEEELLVEHGPEPRPDLLPEQRRCCRPDFQSVELKIFFSQCLTGKKKKSLVLQDHGQLLSGGQLVAHRAAEEGGRRKTERGCEVSHG
ncbi:hypothetical protein OIU79_028934 [Salix purpurea]|uniref:Uncharacterized protein n=1 Tax=Salix purpurea TaxID=77065 RepID=A0A9Q1A3A4_SALPP|nr:hypothetical protein OIU79_028934 [Salix purpurea]